MSQLKGYDRVVAKINEAYDEASKDLDLIPLWIHYRLEYFEKITQRQINIAQECVNTLADTWNMPATNNAIINEPLSFDKILQLSKRFSREQLMQVLDYTIKNPDILGD